MNDTPKLKIERAEKHITDLQEFLRSCFKPDDYHFIHEKDPQTGRSIFEFELLRDVPPDTSLFIGDAIHNLRSALDSAYFLAAKRSGGNPGSHSKLPFADSREKLIGRLMGGSIKHCPELQLMILDEIQPYRTGNYPLWALHQLDIIDKHQLLIAFAQATTLFGVDAEMGGMILHNCSFGISNGRKINIASSTGEIKIHNYGQPSFDILFDKGLPMEGKSVIPTLHQFREIIKAAVREFDMFFEKSQSV